MVVSTSYKNALTANKIHDKIVINRTSVRVTTEHYYTKKSSRATTTKHGYKAVQHDTAHQKTMLKQQISMISSRSGSKYTHHDWNTCPLLEHIF